MKREIASFFCVLLMTCASSVQAEPVKMAYKFTPGELDKYKVDMTMNLTVPGVGAAQSIPPVRMFVGVVVQQRTLEVLPNGSARVKSSYSSPTIKMIGGSRSQQLTVPKRTVSVVATVDPQGRTLGIEGMEKMLAASGLKNFDFSQFTNLMSRYALLPDEPVEPGTTWNQTVPFPFEAGNWSVDSILASYGQRISARAAAKIIQKLSGHMDLGQMFSSIGNSLSLKAGERQMFEKMSGELDVNGTMTFYFAPSVGKVLKGQGEMWATVTIAMPSEAVKQGAPPTMSMEMDMKISLARVQ